MTTKKLLDKPKTPNKAKRYFSQCAELNRQNNG